MSPPGGYHPPKTARSEDPTQEPTLENPSANAHICHDYCGHGYVSKLKLSRRFCIAGIHHPASPTSDRPIKVEPATFRLIWVV